MEDIKRESHIDKQMCHGCLSVDRNLKRLQQNTDLFFMLLNNRAILPDDSMFINILLCWECIALLKRIRTFQNRIQKAQQYLGTHCNLLEDLRSNLTLSSLQIKNECDIDITYNDDEEVKIELELTKTEVKFPDIKEETLDDIDDTDGLPNDIDIYNNTDDVNTDTEGILYDTKNIPKVKHRIRKYVKRLKPNTSLLDMSKIDLNISKVTYTVRDLEILSKEKYDVFKSLDKKITERFKKLKAMKSKDIAKISKSEKPYKCSHCNVELTQDTLHSHWDEHSVVTYKCEFCNKHLLHYSDLNIHMKRSHGNVYTCTVCGMSFSWRRDYSRHFRALHKILICDHCGRRFGNKRSIEKHMICNHLPAKCDICHLTFEKHERLRKHQRRYHAPPAAGESELYYCVECNKQYPHMDAYKQHLRTSVVHVPKKTVRIPCPDCERVFTRVTYMNNHYRLMHVKQSKHYCQACDKYFINGYALRTHRKYVHEKAEKPRLKICDICGKAFNTTRTLVNHRRTHTGERPYRCPHCPAAFAQLSAQKTHARTQHKYLK